MSWLFSLNDQWELDVLLRSQSAQQGWSHPASQVLEFFAAFLTGGPFPAVLPCYLPLYPRIFHFPERYFLLFIQLWERLWELDLLEEAEAQLNRIHLGH